MVAGKETVDEETTEVGKMVAGEDTAGDEGEVKEIKGKNGKLRSWQLQRMYGKGCTVLGTRWQQTY